MKYIGSKLRIAKHILPIILKDRTPGQWYIEPFCGGLNIMDKVGGNRMATDNNKYLIAMWKGLQLNRKRPTRISKELYMKAKVEWINNTNDFFDDFQIGWIGYMASFRGGFFNKGYSGSSHGRNYVVEQIRNTEKQIPKISNIVFKCGNYCDIDYPYNSIIYCDIPYQGTTGYTTSKGFDYLSFWQWCRDMAAKGHRVFVSEYNAPQDFTCVWEKEVTSSLSTLTTYKPTEKLFTITETRND